MTSTDLPHGAADAEWQEQTDPAWSNAAVAMRTLERTGISHRGLFAAGVRVGVRVEAGVRGWCRRTADHRPNWHEGGEGPPIVFLNGWSASGLVWPAAVIEALQADHRVIRIDNRGSGWSRHLPRPYTLGDLADDVRNVLDELGLAEATIAGLSMGGMIAQELALRHPERVSHLVLMGTRPPGPDHTQPAATVTARLLSPPRPGQSLQEFMLRRWAGVTGPGFPQRHPEVIREMVGAIVRRPTPRGAVLDQARAIAGWHGASRLRRLPVPTTVVHGEVDPLVPVRNAMRLVQLIPGATYVELPGIGHLVPFEAPAATVEAVRAASGVKVG